MRRKYRRRALYEDSGQVTAVVVVSVAGLFLFAGLVIDGGLALAGKVRAADTAQDAARAACQEVDLDYLRATHHTRLNTPRADAVARGRVAAVGDTARVQVREDQVRVSVTHIQRTQVLSLVGLDRLTTTASATAHIELGTTTPWDQGPEGAP
ncbi:pilus assembly protein TadG-related protein [Streptomyces sp. NPDC059262]|uniref:pilus assembly protein TadG-related protein n=1 Tax=Streptomyces sp. NPDC059262 TaxID=3346797 RepID=UPI003691F3BE